MLFTRSPVFSINSGPGQAERNAETGAYAAQQDAGIPIRHWAFNHRVEKKKDSAAAENSFTIIVKPAVDNIDSHRTVIDPKRCAEKKNAGEENKKKLDFRAHHTVR